MASTNTVVGWATVLALGGAFYWVNNQRKNKNKRAIPQKQSGKTVDVKESKPKKARREGGQSGAELENKGQNGQKKAAQPNKAAREEAVTSSADHDDELNNREFARQFSQAKAGSLAAPKSQVSSRPKSVKQGRAQEKHIVETSSDNATAPSSANDADDDHSLPNSPDLSATTSSSPLASGDVSDMLEKPAAPAGVLKVLAPTTASQPQKPKVTKAAEPMETKKQRQNRLKAQEAKAIRAQEEEARKVKMEQQRRTAREAEGRAAKDGSTFMASKAPASSAWAPANTNGSSTSKPVELLDTYVPSSSSAASVSDPIYSESEEHGSALQNVSTLSEEEQVRIAMEESENWNIVKAKEKKNRTKATPAEDQKPTEGKSHSADEKKLYNPPPISAPKKPGQAYEATVTYVENGKVYEEKMDLQDSEWEVS